LIQIKNSLPLSFAILGFCVGIALYGYTFYINSHHMPGNDLLFLVLCPPSFAGLALDQAGVLGGIAGWFFISLANAGLYALVGFLIQLIRSAYKSWPWD
jgi:hypothetical protein